MENPYNLSQKPGLMNALEAAKHHAWDECQEALKAEEAEIVSDLKATIVAYEIAISREEKLVSELVVAFKYYIAYGGSTTTTSGRIAWKKARTVIAKATGI
ncbi:hypothetical protein LCGC14_2562330 [marine sediment metagenome]|uniref:Uncharacterized protein n=1 Tax=marine sediment metagenome TaxID=412755 RepID=A0A0F9CVZ1_9ZZZZ